MLRYSPQPVTRCNPLFWPSCAVLWYAHGVILYSRRGIAIFVIKYIQPATGVNVLSCWGLTNGERLEMFIFWLILIFAAVFLCSVIRRHFLTSTYNKTLYFPALCVPGVVPYLGTPQRLNLQPSGEQRPQRPQHNKKTKQKNFGEHTRADLAGAIGSPPASSGSGEMKGTQQEHNKTRVTVI